MSRGCACFPIRAERLRSAHDTERSTIALVWRRIVPPIGLAMLVAILDKVNLSFAALTMNADLGLSSTAFGMAAGAFSIGYVLAGLPLTLLLHRFGARRVIGGMMVAWACCSVATAFVTSPTQLLVTRLLIGMAEAGFAPGAVLYLSRWFPDEYRGRVLSSFFFIQPVGLVVAAPVSTALLLFSGAGLAGWQWLFLVEGVSTLLFTVLIVSLLADRPAQARWLSETQREWLLARLATPAMTTGSEASGPAVLGAVSSKRTWLLAAVYLGLGTSGIGPIFFLPLLIKSMGFANTSSGLLAAIPPLLAALLLPLWGGWTDRTSDRQWVVAAGAAALAGGLVTAAIALPSPWALAGICVAMSGFFGCLAAFWTLPSRFLGGASAAAGIAFINVTGNLGNFAGPALMGRLSDVTQSYAVGLMLLGALAALTAILAARIR